jgi:hypothetical protein
LKLLAFFVVNQSMAKDCSLTMILEQYFKNVLRQFSCNS